MLRLVGSMGIPSWQEAQRSRGDKGIPYISWKSICIYFDAKRYSHYHLKQGEQVTFGVGFTFMGPQAIILSSSTSNKSSSLKMVSYDENQQSIQDINDSVASQSSYSQASKNVNRHGPKNPRK